MVALRLWVRFIVNIDHYPPICIRMYIYRRADIAEKAHGWGRYYYLVPVFIMSISPRDIRTVVFRNKRFRVKVFGPTVEMSSLTPVNLRYFLPFHQTAGENE